MKKRTVVNLVVVLLALFLLLPLGAARSAKKRKHRGAEHRPETKAKAETEPEN